MGVIMHNNIPYGGGSTIEPNPQESATDQLETLGIDGDVYAVTDANAIHTSDVGSANGVAELDSNGKVPASQLPSYVDDVLEYASRSAFPATGETGKIYVALDTNLTYRWSGSDYVEISPSLALGETSSTAYRGDRGKIAYDHSQSDHSGIKPAFTEASTRANIASGESFATIFGKIKKWFSDLKDLAFIGKDGTSSTKYLRGDGTWQNFPTIPTVNDGTLTIKQNNNNLGTFTANQSTASNINIECALPSDVEGSKVATGNPLTITDAAGIKAEKIEIGFEPKQDKHGYGSVWVGGAGKNKWGGNKMKSDILSKISTATSPSDSEVSFYPNGTVQNVRVLENLNGEAFKENTQYTFIVKSKNTNIVWYQSQQIVTTNLGFFYTDGTFDIIYHVGSSANTYYTTAVKSNASKTVSYIGVVYQSGDATFDVTNCGVFEGNVATTEYEPYENISPLTGYTSLSADGCGKNLFDIENWLTTASATYTKSGNTYSISNFVTVHTYYETNGYYQFCKDDEDVVISFSVDSSVMAYLRPVFILYDKNNNEVARSSVGSGSKTIIGKGCKLGSTYSTGSQGSAITLTNFQIEYGTTSPTTYDPFKGDNVTVQFGQTLYGGKLTILQDGSAEVYVDRAGADLSNISFTRKTYTWPDVSGYYWESANVTGMKVSTETMSPNSKLLSDRYVPKGNYDLTGDSEIGIDSVNPRFIVTTVRTSSDMQPTGFTVYPLANPFTLHLSPVETLNLLQGINNIWTDGTTLSLTYQPDNAIGQAKGTAQELVDSASTWKLFAESANANIALPTNAKELYICVIYVTGSTSAIMYDFHILPDTLTKATSYFRQGSYYTPDYFSRCEIRIRKTSSIYDTRVEALYINNTTDRSSHENTTVKVYYR